MDDSVIIGNEYYIKYHWETTANRVGTVEFWGDHLVVWRDCSGREHSANHSNGEVSVQPKECADIDAMTHDLILAIPGCSNETHLMLPTRRIAKEMYMMGYRKVVDPQ